MRTKNDFKKSHLLLSRWSRWSFFRICVARFTEVFIFGRLAEKFEMYKRCPFFILRNFSSTNFDDFDFLKVLLILIKV